MVICNKCGFENHEVAKICNKCNADLSKNDDVASIEEYIKPNTWANILKAFSILALVFGFFGSLILPMDMSRFHEEFNIILMFEIWFVTALTFSVLRGLSEILYTVNRTNYYQKKSYDLLNEKEK